jgi:hypothetical protein
MPYAPIYLPTLVNEGRTDQPKLFYFKLQQVNALTFPVPTGVN